MRAIIALYRKPYSSPSPATWWVSLVMLVNRSGTMVVASVMLYLIVNSKGILSKAGIVMPRFNAGPVCGGLLGGKRSSSSG